MKILSLDIYRFFKYRIIVLFLFFSFSFIAQNGFRFKNEVKYDKIRFKLANNLIVLPVIVNGVELSFVLDTGVGATIIFSLDKKDSLELNNVTKIHLRGLGDGEPVEAIKSLGNTVNIGKATSRGHTVFMVFDESIDLSSRMGFPVHGIIGYDFFKDFIVQVNYVSQYIKVFNPKNFTYKKCKKCYRVPLGFYNKKRPYVSVKYQTMDSLIDVNLLVDTGSGSSLWLFESKERQIIIPENSFKDFLGKGFNGDIYGQRTKVRGLQIGDFLMKEVTASFPDSIYIEGLSNDGRQGSLGGGVLKRFHLIIDYPNEKISFKKNKFFPNPFYYNMSGLTIQHSGVSVAKEYGALRSENTIYDKGIVSDSDDVGVRLGNNLFGIRYSLQPRYEIAAIRPNSPADIAGLKTGDVLLEINGKKAYNYTLLKLNDLFYSKEGRKIYLKINRLGVEIKYVFYLKKVI